LTSYQNYQSKRATFLAHPAHWWWGLACKPAHAQTNHISSLLSSKCQYVQFKLIGYRQGYAFNCYINIY